MEKRADHTEQKDNGGNLAICMMGGIIVLTLLAYYPVFGNHFVNYDDPSYVTANSHVKSGFTSSSIKWAFTTFYFYNWHPLTWISHMLDIQLFGLDPMWHHLTNLLLHIVNTLLLFLLFEQMTSAKWKSFSLAALFALHPLHVESVAWVSERKDLLSTLFWFLAMLAYVAYARKPKVMMYLLCTLLFILGLMAKPMLVTLPFLLLLADYWPLQRLRWGGISDTDGSSIVFPKGSLSNLVLEKVPLVLISVASVIVTYLAQKKGGALRADSSAIVNVGDALVNYARYAIRTVWPSKLAVYYPYDPASVSAWKIVMALVGIIVISVWVMHGAKRLPYLAIGWLWYLIAFVPVIGFIRIGEHAMADRYTYVPLIGLFIIAVWGMTDLAKRQHIHRSALPVLMTIIIMICLVLTNLQARRWQNSVTLFRHALEVTDNNALAHKNLAAALAQQGNLTEALDHTSESLRIQPEPFEYVSQASLYFELGQYEKAIESCKKSIAMLPNNDKAHFILGVSYVRLKDYNSAIVEYQVLKNNNSPYADRLLSHLHQLGVSVPGR